MTLPAGTQAYVKIGGVETPLTPYVKIGGVETELTVGEIGGGGGPALPSAPLGTWAVGSGVISTGAWASTIGFAASVGQLVVVAFATAGASTTAYTVTDSKGNSYTDTNGLMATSPTSYGHLAYCVVSNALTTSDTITITASSGTFTRGVAVGSVWDWEFTSVVQGTWKPESSTTAMESNAATVPDDAVLFGCHGMINSGRTVTVDAPWTGLTKQISAAGSGDRAVQAAWRTLAGGGAGVIYSLDYDTSGAGTTSFLAFVR